MKKVLSGLLVLAIGILLGSMLDLQRYGLPAKITVGAAGGNSPEAPQATAAVKPAEKKILYWVAPMDPKYKRDKPGKSPMGMDLIPVYAEEGAGTEETSIQISAAVVNNLGVRTALVQRQNLERRLDTVGYVSFDETKISHIHLRTDGWVDRLLVKSEGEPVEKGQLLFQYYSPALVNAQEELLQAAESGNRRIVSASEQRLMALGVSEQQVRQLMKTKEVQSLVSIYAPQQGIVSRLSIREGMRVKPEMDIMTLANLQSVWLQTAVSERQADWVVLGSRAEARIPSLPGEVWEGKVDFIYPTLDPKTRTLQVRLQFDTPDKRIKPNMYAKVVIYAPPRKNMLTIPREAVIRSGRGERVVLALGEGRFKSRAVRTGLESGGLLELLGGLDEGDKVVTSAQFLIDSQASLKGSLDRMEGAESDSRTAAAQTPATSGAGAP
ncbi:MAG: efflux RND transporter periplasmic adaptor subunit [Magnetococcales bacterium]|nr:efflux RND transporter periplasmic adaptor subunit [Magnetococcales bacterium]